MDDVVKIIKKYVITCTDRKEFEAGPDETMDDVEERAKEHQNNLIKRGKLNGIFSVGDMPEEVKAAGFNWFVSKILEHQGKIRGILGAVPDIRIVYKEKA